MCGSGHHCKPEPTGVCQLGQYVMLRSWSQQIDIVGHHQRHESVANSAPNSKEKVPTLAGAPLPDVPCREYIPVAPACSGHKPLRTRSGCTTGGDAGGIGGDEGGAIDSVIGLSPSAPTQSSTHVCVPSGGM
eukprot:5925351-Prymnesium_polylepis.3